MGKTTFKYRTHARTTAVLALALLVVSCGKKQFDITPQAESFNQQVTYNNKVDLLWVVDNSRSMSSHQNNLANKFGAFIDILNNKKIDYHIAITTMDMSSSGEKGRFIGSPSVIKNTTPNAKALFQSRILLGEAGSDVERGLEAMLKALSPERLANENAGFFREDAQLAVIFVTNEDDFSAGNVQSYATQLDLLKPANPADFEPVKWMVNFIGITEPNGDCFTRGEIADPGDRYMDLARLSDGQIAEICANDLTQALSNVRRRITERMAEFRLNLKPDIATIRVTVNSVLIPQDDQNGWSYEDLTDQGGPFIIRFHGDSIPSADSRVRIDYLPAKGQ